MSVQQARLQFKLLTMRDDHNQWRSDILTDYYSLISRPSDGGQDSRGGSPSPGSDQYFLFNPRIAS
jgi:hypothetical protein